MMTGLAIAVLLMAPAATPVPSPLLPKATERLTALVSIGGPRGHSLEVVREVLAEAGHEVAEEDADSIYSTWKVLETRTKPPKQARRSRFFSVVDEDSCFIELIVEEASQRDEGNGRFPWGDWSRTSWTTVAERTLFVSINEQLKKRLPIPDPNAPPPGMEPSPVVTPLAVHFTEPIDLKTLGRSPPVALYQPAPPFPAVARNANMSGSVVARIVVDKSGQVTAVTIVKSQPPFDERVVTTLKKWRYQPLIQNGKPVSWRMEVTQEFTAP